MTMLDSRPGIDKTSPSTADAADNLPSLDSFPNFSTDNDNNPQRLESIRPFHTALTASEERYIAHLRPKPNYHRIGKVDNSLRNFGIGAGVVVALLGVVVRSALSRRR